MFCNQCGTQNGDNLSFCSNCGAPLAQAVPQPVQQAVPQPVQPVPQPVQQAVPQPVQQPIPQPVQQPTYAQQVENMVSAMPAPGETAAPVQPAYGAQPTQQGMPAYGAQPMQQGVPTYGAPTPMQGYGVQTPTAMVPVKKKSKAVPIVAAATAVAVVGGGGAAVWFNRGAIEQAITSDEKYAANIEKSTLKAVQERATKENVAMISNLASTALTAYSSTSSGSAGPTMLASIIPMAVNSISASGIESMESVTTIELNLTDTAKGLIYADVPAEGQEMMDKLIEAVNSMSFTVTCGQSDDATKCVVAIDDGNAALSLSGLILKSGEMYVALEPNGTAIKYTLDMEGEVTSLEEIPMLKLDEKEVERLIGEVIDIYADFCEKGEVSKESGEMSVGELSVSGKVYTIDITGKDIAGLFQEIVGHVADDDYFCKTIVDYLNENGMEITEKDLRDNLKNAFKDMNTDSKDVLRIKSVVDNQGNVLGKQYIVIVDGSKEKESPYFTYINAKNGFAAEASANGSAIIFTNESKDNVDGKAALTVKDGDKKFTLNIDYSGVKTEKWNGTEVLVGKCDLSLKVPSDFVEGYFGSQSEMIAPLFSSKISVSNAVEGDKMTSTIKLDVPQYGDLTITEKLRTGVDISVDAPSNYIDINNMSEEQAQQLFEELKGFVEKNPDSVICQMIGSIISNAGGNSTNQGTPAYPNPVDPDPTNPTPGNTPSNGEVDPDEAYALREKVSDLYDLCYDFYSDAYDIYCDHRDDPKAENYYNISDELTDALYEMWSKLFYTSDTMTAAEFAAIKTAYEEAKSEYDSVIDDFKAYAASMSGGSGSSGGSSGIFAPTNYSANDILTMDYDSLIDLLIDMEDKLSDYENDTSFYSANKTAIGKAGEAYDAAVEAFRAINSLSESDSGYARALAKLRSTAMAFAQAMDDIF